MFDLLEYLIQHRERVVSRDELIEQIWGGRVVSESALSTRINAVRNAIGDSGNQQRLFMTLPRKGIRFVSEVREEQKSPEPALVGPADDATIEERQPIEKLPALQAIGSIPPAPIARTRFAARPASFALIAVVGLVCCAVLIWSYFAQSAHAKANVDTAARLTHIAEKINMTSREGYEAVRHLQQWAVSLDPQNASAQARLTFAIVTGGPGRIQASTMEKTPENEGSKHSQHDAPSLELVGG